MFSDSSHLSGFLSRPGERSAKPPLQNLGLGIEPIQLTHPLALPLKRSLRNQADQLPFRRRNFVPESQARNRPVNLLDRRDLEVGDVHRQLSAALGKNSHCFYALQATARGANLAGNGPHDRDV